MSLRCGVYGVVDERYPGADVQSIFTALRIQLIMEKRNDEPPDRQSGRTPWECTVLGIVDLGQSTSNKCHDDRCSVLRLTCYYNDFSLRNRFIM